MARGWVLSAVIASASSVLGADLSVTIPSHALTGGYQYAPVEQAPVGVSIEFFTFPSYFTNVSNTNPCLSNLKDLTGVWPPIRIGGTTQDRADYDAGLSAYVSYSVASAADAPANLTFGPSFFDLAGTYGGTVVMGLDRGHNKINNTISAAQATVERTGNLLAIELGNEPEYYTSDGQPIASSGWSAAIDAQSQNTWDVSVGEAVGIKPIIQAGNSNDLPPGWGAAELIAQETSAAKEYVKTYAHHRYPGGSVESLMNHANIVTDLHQFDADITAALGEGKPYVFGELNSVSGGGAAAVSPTFGAALWTMDYSIRATYSNASRLYFHHGTIGNCQYCFWGRGYVTAPYYGAYMATAFLAEAAYLTAIDAGNSTSAAYVTFDNSGQPLRALLYNSEYYTGTGTRSTASITLKGLSGSSVKSKRLTASNALTRQNGTGILTFGGQNFDNTTCALEGTESIEQTSIANGMGVFQVQASEALLVYLQ